MAAKYRVIHDKERPVESMPPITATPLSLQNLAWDFQASTDIIPYVNEVAREVMPFHAELDLARLDELSGEEGRPLEKAKKSGVPRSRSLGELAKIFPMPDPNALEGNDGHYHASIGPDGFSLVHCRVKHRTPATGRSIQACAEKSWVFVYWEHGRMRNGAVKVTSNKNGEQVCAPFLLSDVGGRAVVFVCKSWRCENCREHIFHRDFTRIFEALNARSEWLFVVLTYNVFQWRKGKQAAYEEFCRKWQILRFRLMRALKVPVEYICVMEQTKRGWPHANLCLTWEGMDLAEDREEYARIIRRWLKDSAPEIGLGYEVSCTPLKDKQKVANYFSKRSLGEPSKVDKARLANEVNFKKDKSYQIPNEAPLYFKRIRASRNTLVPVRKGDGTHTGAIYRPESDREGCARAAGRPVAEGAPIPTGVKRRSGDGGGPKALVRGAQGSGAPRRSETAAGPVGPGVGLSDIDLLTAPQLPSVREGGTGGSRKASGPKARTLREGPAAAWTPERQEWWKLAANMRRELERKGVLESAICDELLKAKNEWFRRRECSVNVPDDTLPF